jgi:hypothetical protein
MGITAGFAGFVDHECTPGSQISSIASEGGGMKGTLRFLVVLAMLGMLAESGIAQAITIDSNDVQAMYSVGRRLTYNTDTLSKNLNIGDPGASGVYNFSTLLSNTKRVLTSVTKSTSPYASEFPTATHAMLDTAFTYRINTGTLGFGWGTVKSSAAYLYFGVGADERFFGIGAIATGYLDQMPTVPITIKNPRWVNSPPSVDLSLPLEYMKSWTNNYADSLIGVINFFTDYNVRIGNTDSVTFLVDGYGTLTVPGGYSQPALRIRKLGRYSFVDSVNNLNIPLQYLYLAKNGASVEVGIDDTTLTSGVVKVRYAKWTIPLPTGVESMAGVPQNFSLEQNYPNPFNPTTTISYSVGVAGGQSSVTGNVRLAVYDMLGREVAVLVNEKKEAGIYSATWNASGMASGMYLYRLTTDGYTATRSMLLLK